MIFHQLNPDACRSYLIGLQNSPEVALVDPVLDRVAAYLELLEKDNLKLRYVIDTHTHADHISGAAAMKDHTNCDYVMYENAPARCPNIKLKDGSEIELGHVKIKVLHTPGHTKDSLSLVFPDRILTGDVLFLEKGGGGRDDLPGGDPGDHWESLQRILELPENLVVFPAHDYHNRKPTTLKYQKQANPHLKPRSKQEFIHYIEDLKLGPAEWMKDVLKANYACAQDPKAAWIPADMPACEVRGTLGRSVNDQVVEGITAKLLARRMRGDERIFLLDVRDPKELTSELGYIHGAVNLPVESLGRNLKELEEYKDREIVTVCRSGGRAHTAAQILMQDGFKHVKVLEGGMKAWRELKE